MKKIFKPTKDQLDFYFLDSGIYDCVNHEIQIEVTFANDDDTIHPKIDITKFSCDIMNLDNDHEFSLTPEHYHISNELDHHLFSSPCCIAIEVGVGEIKIGC